MEKQVSKDREKKKAAAEMLVLALLEERDRHGYEIGKLIEQRSGGVLKYHVASLYTLLYRIEKKGQIRGRWLEKAGERRRRFYKLTDEGRSALAAERQGWREFIQAVDQVAQLGHA
ncbi:MAG: PadR family transcriptional regulator [bacterium]|nr:PadR family transcriptional regulator [bacterium]